MKTAPAGNTRPHSLTWLKQSKYCKELSSYSWAFYGDSLLGSWLAKKYSFKDTLNLVISSCFKALHDRGSLRLKLALSREFKAISPTSPQPETASQPSTWVRGILSLANRPETFEEFGMINLKQTHYHWSDSQERLTDHTTLLQHPPLPPRDWHGGLAPRLGGHVLPARSGDTLIKLFNSGPVHTYPEIYENWDFFPVFKKLRILRYRFRPTS